MLRELTRRPSIDPVLREKLGNPEDDIFADVVLNTILCDTGIHVVIPAMMRIEHIRANVSAATQSRFDSGELARIRDAFVR